MVIADSLSIPRSQTYHCRVEKYRPNTLEDVSGHQDILTTINKFVDTNVNIFDIHAFCPRLMIV